MRRTVPLLITAAVSMLAACTAVAQHKQLHLHTAAIPPVIDGAVDGVWAAADSAADFVQQSPYYHVPPSKRTVAKVLATPDALYCLMLCTADPRTVQQNTGKLDDGGGDIVSIMLDTFGDRQSAYKFAVTAGGVRADCRLLDDARNRDYSWDGVWFSAARMYDWGFAIEMEIPWRSIQYDESLASWGLDFDRWIPAGSEDLYWNSYEETEGQRISKFGSLLFDGFHPRVHGLNLEVYPVGLMKSTRLRSDVYRVEPDAGIDIFYNPSRKLTFQLTGNPDFAQIEADPFAFNISRYETYYDERRPFFTQGNEVFMASGRESNSGFYKPLELFYSRRIGRKLPDGSDVPLIVGSKIFGRLDSWEYGGFIAATGERTYDEGGTPATEARAQFASVRLKKQIFDNSSVGILFVGKHDAGLDNGVLDLDGALRGSNWQLAYQLARSYRNGRGDFAASTGFKYMSDHLFAAVRGRAIGREFDIDGVGFVPWRGLSDVVALAGPYWYFPEGVVRAMMIYGGGGATYEHADLYTDRAALLGLNMNFRANWGFEINASAGKSRDNGTLYPSTDIEFSSWYNISPKWDANLFGGFTRTYNFNRGYQAFYIWAGGQAEGRVLDILQVGTSYNAFIEGDPSNDIAEITWNARPFLTLTPINDFTVHLYVDNVILRSTGRIERVIGGLLFSWQFLPKSWIYLAINDVQTRTPPPATSFEVRERAAVFKVKWLYYL